MLSGYPPFQSKTQEEIYRKVKARAYGWPTGETCANIISQQAKDVVSALLVDATERPEPDEIVGLPFFKSGLIPDRISTSAKQTAPVFQDWTPQTGLSKEAWRHRQWSEICRKCGVGITEHGEEVPPVGGELHKSTYKECLLEEKAGLFPVVPMPETMVYRRFNASEYGPLPDEKQLMPGSFPESPEKKVPSVGDRPSMIDAVPYPAPLNVVRHSVQVQPIVKRQEPRSHAAQLRERDQPKRRVQEPPKGVLKWDADGKGLAYQKEGSAASVTATLGGRAVRLNSRTAKTVSEQPAIARLTRSQASQSQAGQTAGAQTAQQQAAPAKIVSSKREGPSTKASAAPAPRETKRSVSQEQNRSKEGLSPVEETTEADEKPGPKKAAPRPAPTTKANNKLRHASTVPALIDLKEPASLVPHSQAREVQIRLTVMLDSLRTALRRKQPSSRPAVRRSTTLPLVIKWVDYSNKFGIGYTLNDGSMGCLLNSEGGGPSTGVFVRGNIDRPTGADGKAKKEPSIPLYGRPIELYENCGEKGFKHLQIKPEEYQIYLGNGHDDKNEDGKPKRREWIPSEQRKRRAILLWARFANYMRDALAKSGSDAIKKAEDQESDGQTGPCVLFYQRLGNVGIWGFDDGSFQVMSHL